MATALERAVEALSDPSASTADALRGLLVVSRRISADDLSTWIKSELDGYRADQEVPAYRRGDSLPISIRFDGYGGSQVTRRLSQRELPDELVITNGVHLRQPVAELAALCAGDHEQEPQVQLPLLWLATFRRLADENRVPHMPMMVADHAAVLAPRTHLLGILDRVKSAALDLALDLEDASLEAGAAGGPTVDSVPALASAVTVNLNQIFANNSTVAVGDNASVVNVQVGDIDGLFEAARSLLSEEGVKALADAIEEDGGEPGRETRSFLDRVRGGAFVLGSGIATNGAYEGLVHVLGSVFPGFSP